MSTRVRPPRIDRATFDWVLDRASLDRSRDQTPKRLPRSSERARPDLVPEIDWERLFEDSCRQVRINPAEGRILEVDSHSPRLLPLLQRRGASDHVCLLTAAHGAERWASTFPNVRLFVGGLPTLVRLSPVRFHLVCILECRCAAETSRLVANLLRPRGVLFLRSQATSTRARLSCLSQQRGSGLKVIGVDSLADGSNWFLCRRAS